MCICVCKRERESSKGRRAGIVEIQCMHMVMPSCYYLVVSTEVCYHAEQETTLSTQLLGPGK